MVATKNRWERATNGTGQPLRGIWKSATDNDLWLVRVHVGRDSSTGKVTQVSRTVKGGIRAAQKTRATLVAEVDAGMHGRKPVTADGVMTVGRLLNDWLAQGERLGRSPNTLDGYRTKIEAKIRPALGAVPIEQLTPSRIDDWYGALHDAGMSDSSIHHHHTILAAALHQGVKWGLIQSSPTDRATPPRARRAELNVPPPERVRTLIDLAAASKAPEMAAVITLAALTGMRRGEQCGLRWGDVDWDDHAITVRRAIWQTKDGWGVKDPKTHQVRRLVLGEAAMAVLAGRWKRATENAAEAEVPLGADAYVFASDVTGLTPTLPHSWTQAFTRLCRRAEEPALTKLRESDPDAKRADLPAADRWDYRLHDLRHYMATALFRAGVNPRTVADRLGHADPSITLRVYVSDTEDQARAAANALEAGLAPP